MISAEDCEFIKKFEVANSEEKQVILTNEGHQVYGSARLKTHMCCIVWGSHYFYFILFPLQCAKTFLNLMAHISKEQTVQYILTLIDDTLQVL